MADITEAPILRGPLTSGEITPSESVSRPGSAAYPLFGHMPRPPKEESAKTRPELKLQLEGLKCLEGKEEEVDEDEEEVDKRSVSTGGRTTAFLRMLVRSRTVL